MTAYIAGILLLCFTSFVMAAGPADDVRHIVFIVWITSMFLTAYGYSTKDYP